MRSGGRQASSTFSPRCCRTRKSPRSDGFRGGGGGREGGTILAVSGGGINDAPAWAQADVGIAIGTGTDIAIEAADITLMRGDLGAAVDAIALARRTMRIMRQNLFWAFI